MKKQIFLFFGLLLISNHFYGQSLLSPTNVRYFRSMELPNSTIFPGETKSLTGYVRGSAYGGGKDFDYANLFGEAAIKANYVKGFTEGYGYFRGEVRVRNGVFFNDNNGQAQTQLEIRELYAGYKSNIVDVKLGNQNVQWGRGFTGNPTNNISASNGFMLTANGDDQKLYNFMARTIVTLNKTVDWETIFIPVYQMNTSRVDLYSLPPGIGVGAIGTVPHEFKNSTMATRLNLNVGPMGGSLSYFRGYDVNPGVQANLSPTGPIANAAPFKKQVFGADFGWRFGGKSFSRATEPTNDWILTAEGAYTKTDNPDKVGYIPQDNFAYNVSLLKQIWNATKTDSFTAILGYSGKYTPNWEAVVAPTDPTSPTFVHDIIYSTEKGLSQLIFGQYKSYVHSVTGVFTKTFMTNKLNATLIANYGFTPQEGKINGTSHPMMFSPRMGWNINAELSASAGAFLLKGAGSQVVSPVLNGGFLELKYNFNLSRFKTPTFIN